MRASPRRRPDLLFAPIEDEYVLYDPVSDSIHVLDRAAAAVWVALDSTHDHAALRLACRTALGSDGAAAESAVDAVLAELGRAGLLESAPGAAPPAEPGTPLEAARTLLMRRRFAEAIAALEGADELPQEGRGAGLTLRGTARLHAGDLTGAEASFQKALTYAPEDPRALSNLGTVHFLRGRDEAAREAYEAALLRDPRFAAGWSNLGCVHRRQGRADEAERCYRQARSLDPRDPNAAQNLATLLAGQGRLADALAVLEEGLAAGTLGPRLPVTLARLQVASGAPQEAEATLRRAMAVMPRAAALHLGLGVVLAQGGHTAAARTSFEAACRLDPESSGARWNLAQLDALEERWEQAADETARLLARFPDRPDIRVLCARALTRTGRSAEAEALLQAGLTLPASALPCAEALVAHFQTRRRRPEALLVYQRVATRLSDGEVARFPRLAAIRRAITGRPAGVSHASAEATRAARGVLISDAAVPVERT